MPATLGLIVLATPIVRLLFERGQFLPSDTAATAAALQFYAIGLVGYSAARIASPVFYALGRSRVPVAAQHRCRSPSTSSLSLAAGAGDGLPRSGARHVARGARQRRALAAACCDDALGGIRRRDSWLVTFGKIVARVARHGAPRALVAATDP